MEKLKMQQCRQMLKQEKSKFFFANKHKIEQKWIGIKGTKMRSVVIEQVEYWCVYVRHDRKILFCQILR